MREPSSPDTEWTPPTERLKWLLDFAEAQLEASTPRQLQRMFREAMDLATGHHAVNAIELGVIRQGLDEVTGYLRADPETSLKVLKVLQPHVIDALTAVKRRLWWELPHVPRSATLFETSDDFDENRSLRVTYSGTLVSMFLFAMVDAMVAAWPYTRSCAREECGQVFFPTHGRQIHCSGRCSEKKRQAKYAATRSRPRDTRTEYEKRIRAKLGPNVKPKRRSRKAN